MSLNRRILPPAVACAAVAALATPLAAATITQTESSFQASGSIASQDFNREDDRTLSFDPFDTSLGTLTGVTIDYDLSSNVAGSFDYAVPGGGWNANTVVVLDWEDGSFRRENGDGDGNGGSGGGSDAFGISASLSGSGNAEDLARFTGGEGTDVFVKYVYNLNGGPGSFDAAYDFDSAVSLTYDYIEAGDGNGQTGDGGDMIPAPIPLPAGLPLLLGGLGMLGLTRCKRRS